jgi:multiple sugar transport system ATP-binding protein
VARIVLDSVTKVFDKEVLAVDGVTMEIGDGEFMVLVGPSGCGKSTLLRIIAGLEDVTDGEVMIGDRIVTDLAPKDRDVAMVFQNYALYPHMTVEQNLGIGLKLRHVSRTERKRKVEEVAETLDLTPLLARKPAQLSGGQRQRVAMGRAMVREPLAFLMDEPLSNLDAKLRVQMRAELASLRDRLRTTTVYVTHDQVEAMTLGDRVAVMNAGVVQQLDRPQNLYHHPVNLFVAAFMGSPSMNLIQARVADGCVRFGSNELPIPAGVDLSAYADGPIVVGIRPSHFADAALPHDESLPTLDVEVGVVEELGAEKNLIFALDVPPVETEATRSAMRDPTHGSHGTIIGGADATICTAQVDFRCACRPGSSWRLAVDTAMLHFFDLESGAVIGGAPGSPGSPSEAGA